MRQRNIALDFIRILACVLVVCYHAPNGTNPNATFLGLNSLLCIPRIGLFFMVSGALLLPVKYDTVDFLKKRFSKIAIPTVSWCLIYLFLELFISHSDINPVSAIFSIPFSAQGSGGILWFMYSLTGLYLLAPIISHWLENSSKQVLRIYLFLWAITLCYPLLDKYLYLNLGVNNVLYYFEGYAGYFVLGYYFKRFPEDFSNRMATMLLTLIFCLAFILKRFIPDFSFGEFFQYLSILNAVMVVTYFRLIYNFNKLNLKHNELIIKISNLTFGIYLIHMALLKFVLWQNNAVMEISNYAIRSFVLDLLAFTISAAIAFIISKTPLSPYLIGISKSSKSKQ